MGFGLYLINELKINGQTVDDNDDFNLDDEDTQTDVEKQTENPEDAAQNAAEDAAENQQDATEAEPQQDNTPEEDTENDPEDGFTIDDTDEADTTATEAEDEGDDDFTIDTGDEGTEDTNTNAGADIAPAEDGTDDGNDDFTVTGDEDGGEEKVSNSGDDEPAPSGENTTQQTQNSPSPKQAPSDPTDGIDDDEDRAAEEAIYDSLTDDQKRIRVLQLKLNYKDLYDTMSTAIEGINGIPKNSDNIESIKRLIMLLTKARNILIDYLENNFDFNPYLENYTMYIKYMAVFRTASKVIEELNPSDK